MMELVSNFLASFFVFYFCIYFCIGCFCYLPNLYLLFNKGWNVEVVFSLERQNKLIEHCHSGVGPSLTSQAQNAHFGHDKMLALLNHRSKPISL